MIMELKGINGILELHNDKIVIKRKGAVAKLTQGFTKGDKSIYLKQITGVDFKLGGSLTNGYLQFTIAGSNERRGGVLEATTDENTVTFKKKDNDTATQIKEKIEEIQQLGSNSTQTTSGADEIKKYKELLDGGIITEDEFNQKKTELLGI